MKFKFSDSDRAEILETAIAMSHRPDYVTEDQMRRLIDSTISCIESCGLYPIRERTTTLQRAFDVAYAARVTLRIAVDNTRSDDISRN